MGQLEHASAADIQEAASEVATCPKRAVEIAVRSQDRASWGKPVGWGSSKGVKDGEFPLCVQFEQESLAGRGLSVGPIEVPLRVPNQIVVPDHAGRLWMEFVEHAELSRTVDLENGSTTVDRDLGTIQI